MAHAPAFQLYASDFLASTVDMTAAELGVYIRALCVQWDKGAVAAQDEARMARQFGVSVEDFAAIWPVVSAKFRLTRAGYVNARLEGERKKQAEYRKRQAERGKASGAARKRTPVEPALNQRSTSVPTSVEPREPEPGPNFPISDLHTPSPEDQKHKTPRTKRAEPAVGFDEFWQAYPLKVGKCDAERVWNKLAPNAELRATIAAALSWQAKILTFVQDGQVKGKQAAGWLNSKRWLDERPSAAAHAGATEVRPRNLPAAQPVHNFDWWDDCKARHGNTCPHRAAHESRSLVDDVRAGKAQAAS